VNFEPQMDADNCLFYPRISEVFIFDCYIQIVG